MATRAPSSVTDGTVRKAGILRLAPRPEADLVGIGRHHLLRRPDMQLAAFGVDDGGIAGLDRLRARP